MPETRMLMKKVAEPQTLAEPVANGVLAYASITYGVPPVSWLKVLMSKTAIGLVAEHPAGSPVCAYWKSLMVPAVPVKLGSRDPVRLVRAGRVVRGTEVRHPDFPSPDLDVADILPQLARNRP